MFRIYRHIGRIGSIKSIARSQVGQAPTHLKRGLSTRVLSPRLAQRNVASPSPTNRFVHTCSFKPTVQSEQIAKSLELIEKIVNENSELKSIVQNVGTETAMQTKLYPEQSVKLEKIDGFIKDAERNGIDINKNYKFEFELFAKLIKENPDLKPSIRDYAEMKTKTGYYDYYFQTAVLLVFSAWFLS